MENNDKWPKVKSSEVQKRIYSETPEAVELKYKSVDAVDARLDELRKELGVIESEGRAAGITRSKIDQGKRANNKERLLLSNLRNILKKEQDKNPEPKIQESSVKNTGVAESQPEEVVSEIPVTEDEEPSRPASTIEDVVNEERVGTYREIAELQSPSLPKSVQLILRRALEHGDLTLAQKVLDDEAGIVSASKPDISDSVEAAVNATVQKIKSFSSEKQRALAKKMPASSSVIIDELSVASETAGLSARDLTRKAASKLKNVSGAVSKDLSKVSFNDANTLKTYGKDEVPTTEGSEINKVPDINLMTKDKKTKASTKNAFRSQIQKAKTRASSLAETAANKLAENALDPVGVIREYPEESTPTAESADASFSTPSFNLKTRQQKGSLGDSLSSGLERASKGFNRATESLNNTLKDGAETVAASTSLVKKYLKNKIPGAETRARKTKLNESGPEAIQSVYNIALEEEDMDLVRQMEADFPEFKKIRLNPEEVDVVNFTNMSAEDQKAVLDDENKLAGLEINATERGFTKKELSRLIASAKTGELGADAPELAQKVAQMKINEKLAELPDLNQKERVSDNSIESDSSKDHFEKGQLRIDYKDSVEAFKERKSQYIEAEGVEKKKLKAELDTLSERISEITKQRRRYSLEKLIKDPKNLGEKALRHAEKERELDKKIGSNEVGGFSEKLSGFGQWYSNSWHGKLDPKWKLSISAALGAGIGAATGGAGGAIARISSFVIGYATGKTVGSISRNLLKNSTENLGKKYRKEISGKSLDDISISEIEKLISKRMSALTRVEKREAALVAGISFASALYAGVETRESIHDLIQSQNAEAIKAAGSMDISSESAFTEDRYEVKDGQGAISAFVDMKKDLLKIPEGERSDIMNKMLETRSDELAKNYGFWNPAADATDVGGKESAMLMKDDSFFFNEKGQFVYEKAGGKGFVVLEDGVDVNTVDGKFGDEGGTMFDYDAVKAVSDNIVENPLKNISPELLESNEYLKDFVGADVRVGDKIHSSIFNIFNNHEVGSHAVKLYTEGKLSLSDLDKIYAAAEKSFGADTLSRIESTGLGDPIVISTSEFNAFYKNFLGFSLTESEIQKYLPEGQPVFYSEASAIRLLDAYTRGGLNKEFMLRELESGLNISRINPDLAKNLMEQEMDLRRDGMDGLAGNVAQEISDLGNSEQSSMSRLETTHLTEELAKKMGIDSKDLKVVLSGGVPIEINGVRVPEELYTEQQKMSINVAGSVSEAMGNPGERGYSYSEGVVQTPDDVKDFLRDMGRRSNYDKIAAFKASGFFPTLNLDNIGNIEYERDWFHKQNDALKLTTKAGDTMRIIFSEDGRRMVFDGRTMLGGNYPDVNLVNFNPFTVGKYQNLEPGIGIEITPENMRKMSAFIHANYEIKDILTNSPKSLIDNPSDLAKAFAERGININEIINPKGLAVEDVISNGSDLINALESKGVDVAALINNSSELRAGAGAINSASELEEAMRKAGVDPESVKGDGIEVSGKVLQVSSESILKDSFLKEKLIDPSWFKKLDISGFEKVTREVSSGDLGDTLTYSFYKEGSPEVAKITITDGAEKGLTSTISVTNKDDLSDMEYFTEVNAKNVRKAVKYINKLSR